MLSAAHVLAMDSKNLLDVIDGVRIRHGLATYLPSKHSAVWSYPWQSTPELALNAWWITVEEPTNDKAVHMRIWDVYLVFTLFLFVCLITGTIIRKLWPSKMLAGKAFMKSKDYTFFFFSFLFLSTVTSEKGNQGGNRCFLISIDDYTETRVHFLLRCLWSRWRPQPLLLLRLGVYIIVSTTRPLCDCYRYLEVMTQVVVRRVFLFHKTHHKWVSDVR